MRKNVFLSTAIAAILTAGFCSADDVQWVRVTVLLEAGPESASRADGNLIPGGVYSLDEVVRRGQAAIDDEILERVRFLAGEIRGVETSMRLARLVPRQYYLPLRVGEGAVLPVVDLNPRLGIVLTPQRFADERVVCKVQFLEPEGPPGPVDYSGEPITLTLKDAALRDVLKTFSAVTGREILLDEGVSGKVTLDLREVPWDQALDVVLRINDLGLQAEGGLLRVVALDELSRRKRVRTEATINLPRGAAGSATIASRGDEVNRTVVLVVESVAGEPGLVTERDGLLRPPAFSIVSASGSADNGGGRLLVFRGTAAEDGDLKDVEVLQSPTQTTGRALQEAIRMARPWTVLDEQVRRIEAVVGYGLRITPSPPSSLEPVHVSAVEHIGIEMEVGPPPPQMVADHPDHCVVTVYVKDLDTGEVISAPRISARKGEEATVRSSIPGADGTHALFEMKILVAEDRRHVAYSWTITHGDVVVSAHKAELDL